MIPNSRNPRNRIGASTQNAAAVVAAAAQDARSVCVFTTARARGTDAPPARSPR